MRCSKAMLRGKFIALNVYIRKEERSKVNSLSFDFKKLEKEEQMKPKKSGRKKIEIRVEINEIEMKKTTAKINKTKSSFFEKINKIDKPLSRLIKKERERTQINKIRNKKGEIATDTAKRQMIIRDYYKQLYANKIDNPEEMDKFLEKFNFPRLNRKN